MAIFEQNCAIQEGRNEKKKIGNKLKRTSAKAKLKQRKNVQICTLSEKLLS